MNEAEVAGPSSGDDEGAVVFAWGVNEDIQLGLEDVSDHPASLATWAA